MGRCEGVRGHLPTPPELFGAGRQTTMDTAATARVCDAAHCVCHCHSPGYTCDAHTLLPTQTHTCAACSRLYVCTRKAHFDTYRTRIRTLLPFRPSLLGGVSCVYNRVQRSRLNGQLLNGQRNGHLHCTRRSVEDRP